MARTKLSVKINSARPETFLTFYLNFSLDIEQKLCEIEFDR